MNNLMENNLQLVAAIFSGADATGLRKIMSSDMMQLHSGE